MKLQMSSLKNLFIAVLLMASNFIAIGQSTPTNVSASDGAYPDKVLITWTNVNNAPFFMVFRNTTNNSATATALAGVWFSQTSFEDKTALKDVSYYYWVKASVNNLGKYSQSAISNSDQGYLAYINASDGLYMDKITVSWKAEPNKYFQVYRSLTNNAASATALGNWAATNSYDDWTTQPGVSYYYWLKSSTNASGSGAILSNYSDIGYRSTEIPSMNAYRTNDKVEVSWNGATGNYFRVYRNTTNNFSTAQVLGGAWQLSSNFMDNTLSYGITYYYWVRSSLYSDGKNPSLVSQYSSAYKGAYPAWNIRVSKGLYTDYALVEWNGTLGGNIFQVYRGETPDSTASIVIKGWSYDISYQDKTALPGKDYYYWIRSATSVNGANPSIYVGKVKGYRAVAPAINVSGSKGTFVDRIRITWTTIATNPGAYYQVYHSYYSDPNTATAISGWQTAKTFDDMTYRQWNNNYYWVKSCMNNQGINASAFGSYGTGYRKYPTLVNSPISPNPAIDNILLRFSIEKPSEVKIQVFDLTGKLLLENTNFYDFKENEYKMDISTLSNGTYIVSIKTDISTNVEKLIIQK